MTRTAAVALLTAFSFAAVLAANTLPGEGERDTNTSMMDGHAGVNDDGKAGGLTAAERKDMATFLLAVPYPPAQRRAYTNVVSDRAKKGFELFHIEGDIDPGKVGRNVCGNCHRMPFLVSTNTPATGMDAPTWRGAYDRFLILPQGRLNIIDFDFYRRVAERGQPGRSIWPFSWGGRPRFDPVWDMVLEAGTGYPGAFARQVTLNEASADAGLTGDLLDALERAAGEGAVELEGEGVFLRNGASDPVQLQFEDGTYVKPGGDRGSFTRKELVSRAAAGTFVGTFTARHGPNAGPDHPQPALWTLGPIHAQRGRQEFPILHAGKHTMTLSGRHIRMGASVVVDGRRVPGTVRPRDGEVVEIELPALPPVGLHLVQVQNPGGLVSNDFNFHVAADAEAARERKDRIARAHRDTRTELVNAVTRADTDAIKKLLDGGAKINARRPEDGSTPLNAAAFQGHLDVVKLRIERGAKVDATNRDGNTPLHVAAGRLAER